ncbi:MAG: DUF308 domain-containing protein [Bacilli bacterium]|nr:DUF308 domain-containing protein [Bacilli bacterium]
MLKKFNQIINEAIGVSIIFLLLGIIFLIYPNISIQVVAYLIAFILIGSGIYLIGLEFTNRIIFFPMDTLFNGIISVILGTIILIYPNIFQIIIPIMLGTYFILDSIFKLKVITFLRRIDNTSWILTLLLTILSIICGIVLIANPLDSSIAIALFAGIILIVYSITGIIDMLLFKKNIHDLVKEWKKNIKIIEE